MSVMISCLNYDNALIFIVVGFYRNQTVQYEDIHGGDDNYDDNNDRDDDDITQISKPDLNSFKKTKISP